jgi:NADH-quinone oxidoreductase subunit J
VTVAEVIFYILAILVIVASIGVVTVPNVVHAALFLILSLLGVSGFYILLSNEFLALVQILIYAGTISILVLLGLMLTRGREQNLPTVGAGAQWPLALIGSLVLGGVLLTAVLDVEWPRDNGIVTLVDINTLGGALFRDWLLPFELVSVLLTVALIGAVVIAHRDEEEA